MQSLIEKYDVPGPRYTSYPTVPYWDSPIAESQWIEHLKNSLAQAKQGCGIYIHIPFCEKLCSYCGCHKFITKNHSVAEPYVHSLLREWDLYSEKLPEHFPLSVSEIHLGGGTPTFLPEATFAYLMRGLYKRIKSLEEVSISVEVDPRTTKDGHLEIMRELGVTRLSLGVQDFNKRVQNAVNRNQPYEMVASLTEKARKLGFKSLNFDLIYGLPFQTPDSTAETFEKVVSLAPDRIAYYSYAHVPWMKASQRLFKDEDLPMGRDKQILCEIGTSYLKDHNYINIGMDHFAKPDEELSVAMRSGHLHRNFMGYTTRRSLPIFGLGVSAIGDSWSAFWQNSKDLNAYKQSLDKGRLPHERSHMLSNEDVSLREQILGVMTKYQTLWSGRPVWLDDELITQLNSFEHDGLISRSDSGFLVTNLGKNFVRNIAMAFDLRLRRSKPKSSLFSRTV